MGMFEKDWGAEQRARDNEEEQKRRAREALFERMREQARRNREQNSRGGQ